VEALRRGRVVAGELRLRHPLQLEGDLRQLLLGVPGGRCRCSDRRPDAYGGPKCRKSPDPVLTSLHPVPFPLRMASPILTRCHSDVDDITRNTTHSTSTTATNNP